MTRRTFLGSIAAAFAGSLLSRLPFVGPRAEVVEEREKRRCVWMGRTGDFGDPANWMHGSVPGVGDDVHVFDGYATMMIPAGVVVSNLYMFGGQVAAGDASCFADVAICGPCATPKDFNDSAMSMNEWRRLNGA